MIEVGDRVRFGCYDWSMPGTAVDTWKVPLVPLRYIKVEFHLSKGTALHNIWLLEVQLRKIND